MKVVMLTLKQKRLPIEMVVHPVVIVGEHECILIDCGFMKSYEVLEQAFEEVGLKLSQITKIIITHHDHDHIGNLAILKQNYPNIEILATEIENAYLQGELNPIRLEQAQAVQATLNPEQQAFGQQFINLLQQLEPVKVDTIIKDNDIICQELEVIATPGHMDGHISIYHAKTKALIAGDALGIVDQQLTGANPQYSKDLMEACQSIKKILSYDIEKIICYHGGSIKHDVRKELEMLVSSCE